MRWRVLFFFLKSTKRGVKSKEPANWFLHVLRTASGLIAKRRPVLEHGTQTPNEEVFCASIYQSSSPLRRGRHGWTAHRETTHRIRAPAGQGQHRGGRIDLRGCPITFQVPLWEKSELSWTSLPFCLSWDGLLVFILKYTRRQEVQRSLQGL